MCVWGRERVRFLMCVALCVSSCVDRDVVVDDAMQNMLIIGFFVREEMLEREKQHFMFFCARRSI